MYPTEENIRSRFFQVLDLLKERKVIRGLGTFCRTYNLDRTRLSKIKNRTQGYKTIEVVWIAYLSEYGVSPDWIITGKGKMFQQ